MVSRTVRKNQLLLLAVLLIARSALGFPSTTDVHDLMLNDDYDYDTDEPSAPSPQTKPTGVANAYLPLVNRTLTKTGILGEDVVLKCDENITEANVILWFQDSKMITSDRSVVLPNFSLNPKNFDLTILKASPQSAGTYSCQILPQNVFVSTKVVLGDHSLDVITPESSRSGQNSLQRLALLWLLSACLALAHQLKH
ncbi:uncharacterized protein LOC115483435 [Drosophila hydei]|uniref:Uncharacterized protein LOC111595251 n=1 Tax=Drosophila hydei TaxID=7224 RepID=A0A6J1LEP5_DROHY|nr:uncharacterized protein LOC111595251 [Drosophila hydei]XP_030078949.1 uncharacterized protein LOC115482849 [Drosophila hydei]XP_030081264.1 uncharacterized protein LOC115483435 [Drosophila hydei]